MKLEVYNGDDTMRTELVYKGKGDFISPIAIDGVLFTNKELVTLIKELGSDKVQKEQAIELLKKEDIKNVINEIKDNNLKVVYWKSGEDLFTEDEIINLWSIDNVEIFDWLHFYQKLNLHWTLVVYDIIEAIKKHIAYEIE